MEQKLSINTYTFTQLQYGTETLNQQLYLYSVTIWNRNFQSALIPLLSYSMEQKLSISSDTFTALLGIRDASNIQSQITSAHHGITLVVQCIYNMYQTVVTYSITCLV